MDLRHYVVIVLLTVCLGGADGCGTEPYDCDSPEDSSGFLSGSAETTGRYVVRINPGQVAGALGGDLVATDLMALANALGAEEIELINYSNDMFTCEFGSKKEAKAAAKMTGVIYVQEERSLSIPKPVTPPAQPEESEEGEVGAEAVDGTYAWGLDRINERARLLDGNTLAKVRFAGEKHVIVIDTGVDERHEEFDGRIGECHSTVPGSSSCRDGHGHGTHVAGTIAGDDFGVCKECIIHYCRGLDNDGRGSDSSIIGCINWARDLASGLNGIKVINMSLGGDTSQAFDDAVCQAIDDGIHVVVAAGNESENACGSSPAHVAQAVTVYATDDGDDLAFFSNDGRCTDIGAPGVDIRSATRGDSGSTELSGTSMASPHVAGTVAIYGSEADALANATPDVVDGQLNDGPNLLAYDGE